MAAHAAARRIESRDQHVETIDLKAYPKKKLFYAWMIQHPFIHTDVLLREDRPAYFVCYDARPYDFQGFDRVIRIHVIARMKKSDPKISMDELKQVLDRVSEVALRAEALGLIIIFPHVEPRTTLPFVVQGFCQNKIYIETGGQGHILYKPLQQEPASELQEPSLKKSRQ